MVDNGFLNVYFIMQLLKTIKKDNFMSEFKKARERIIKIKDIIGE